MESNCFFSRPHQFDEKPIDILFFDQEPSARLESTQTTFCTSNARQ
jgi:hypothetical protein